jgi:hypothetical protein
MTPTDAGSDAAPLCGSELCNPGTVCCVTKVPVSASCVAPEQFASLGCELPPPQQVPCFSPAECDAGQVCCLNETVFSVECQSAVMCPGGGVSGTFHACASAADCPYQVPNSCQNVPGTGDAGVLKYCDPRFQ